MTMADLLFDSGAVSIVQMKLIKLRPSAFTPSLTGIAGGSTIQTNIDTTRSNVCQAKRVLGQ